MGSAESTAQAFLEDKRMNRAYDFLVQSAHTLLDEFNDGAGFGVEVVVRGGFGSCDELMGRVVLLCIGLVGSTIHEHGGGSVGESDGAICWRARCFALCASLALLPL